MKIYLVGGAVRDALLGLPVKDRDWVVVGATPDEMISQGFKPVGQDFPVFLHPVTHEEYALARTERKTAPGYRGFAVHAAPGVTLEEDLARRDITINSIAVDANDLSTNGTFSSNTRLIDPFGGQQDLDNRVLRHVTEAFREDPVRILRVARFAARFADFSLALDTLALMQDIVARGETNALVPERVWQELSRGLMEPAPARQFEVLAQCGALPHLLTGGMNLAAQQTPLDWAVLDRAAQRAAPLPVRFALLSEIWHNHTASREPLLPRLPKDCSEVAAMLRDELHRLNACARWAAADWAAWLQKCDAFRRPQRCLSVVQAAELWLQHDLPAAGVLAAAQTVRLGDNGGDPGTGALTTNPPTPGPEMAARLLAARTQAIARHLA